MTKEIVFKKRKNERIKEIEEGCKINDYEVLWNTKELDNKMIFPEMNDVGLQK